MASGDGRRTSVFYSSYSADEFDPWGWSPDPLCHELWRVALVETGDGDGDGVPDEADVCPRDADPAQADADGDGEGDACDCRPADGAARRPRGVERVRVRIDEPASGAVIDWDETPGAESYRVSRGTLSEIEAWRYGACDPRTYVTGPHIDPDLPPAGDGYFYLVIAEDAACGLGSLGPGGPGPERINLEVRACR